jgi:hypothetical protein
MKRSKVKPMWKVALLATIVVLSLAWLGSHYEKPTAKPFSQSEAEKIRKAADVLTAFGDRMHKSLCDEPLKPLPKMDGVYLPPEEKTDC